MVSKRGTGVPLVEGDVFFESVLIGSIQYNTADAKWYLGNIRGEIFEIKDKDRFLNLFNNDKYKLKPYKKSRLPSYL